jgi:hypothetical protein
LSIAGVFKKNFFDEPISTHKSHFREYYIGIYVWKESRYDIFGSQVACSRTNRFGGDDLIAFDDKHPSKEVV